MSGTPKRLLEDGGHSTASKRQHDESSQYSSLPVKPTTQSVSSEYRIFEAGSDGRMAKIPRLESRDVDSRAVLDRLYRMPSPANGSCLGHPGPSEARVDVRDPKDSRDVKLDVRDPKEVKELYAETRLDTQVNKSENDSRVDSRGDDKESRNKRNVLSIYKYDDIYEKDGVSASTSHLNSKEQKEHQRSKRYSEPSGDMLEPWRLPQHNVQTAEESDKLTRTGLTGEGLESWEAHDVIGDGKTDLKEERGKEKDRMRKDDKYRDWGERDKDRADRHNLHLGCSSKEPAREDRDSERWDRGRKESHKMREGKERDKDHVKKPPSSLNEKESMQIVKDHIDNFVKTSDQVAATSEPKRTRESDSWKGSERDSKDRKRDRDQDAEVERHDKQARGNDKELDDGCAEGDVVTERDRDTFVYGTQHRRRMVRQRGSSQATSREPKLRVRSRENEISQEKAEVSSIVYKVGECMQEILKAWKEFQALCENGKDENLQNGPTLEIRIPAEHVTAVNRQVRGGQLWGTDIYTDDSDLVAVLMHTGYCRPTASPPPSAIHELCATIRVLPPQDCYTSTLRNNVRSRAWGAGISCSFGVERCCIVKKGGGTIDLEPRLNHISAVEPTLAPVSAERTMTTRSAASNALRQQRFVREVTIQYNLRNEPWLKYSISAVADKGLKKAMYTSARLKKGEVLYLETQSQRYELCFSGEKILSNGTATTSTTTLESGQGKSHHSSHTNNGERNHDRDHIVDLFRWSRCKKPLTQKAMRSIGIPLPTEHLEVLDDNLEWEDVQWSQTGVSIAGKEYALARAHFLSSV